MSDDIPQDGESAEPDQEQEHAVDPAQSTLDEEAEIELPKEEQEDEARGSVDEFFMGESPWPDEPRMGPVDKAYPLEPASETVLHNSVTDFTRMPDGGMLMMFTPVMQVAPGNWMAATPAFTVEFDPDSWKIFKERAAADGKLPERVRARSRIHVADRIDGKMH